MIELNDEQIAHMVQRFLAWKLPEDFRPDGGITFKAAFNEHTQWPMRHEPSGTNLFDARQAEAMVRYIVAGMPALSRRPDAPSAGEWMPIETAPKDGTEFLAYWKPPAGGQAAAVVAKWLDDYGGGFYGLNVADGAGFRTASSLSFGFDGRTLYATHWRPLPAPPQADGGDPQP